MSFQMPKPVEPDTITVLRDDGTQVPTGEQVMEVIRGKSSKVLLGFSCGKDSIACMLALARAGFEILPFYMYLVPDLAFVEESLEYYGKFFGTRIIRIPHPSFYRMLRNYVYQPPERLRVIEACELPVPDYEYMADLLREDLGLGAEVYNAAGVRAVDSPNRYRAVKRYGPINHKRRSFWPVWDWRKRRLVEEFHKADIRLPIDYKWFGRSFDGIDYRFLGIIKEKSPADYRRILDWFPLADVEIKRREYAQKVIS